MHTQVFLIGFAFLDEISSCQNGQHISLENQARWFQRRNLFLSFNLKGDLLQSIILT